jgi:glutamate racemase
VGVLATAATVRSHSYEQALLALKPGLEVISVAAPRLVPLVEEGHLSPDDPVLTEAVEKSVAAIRASRVELMILGCTHYPLISSAIDKALHGRVRLIDNSRELAKSLSKTLCRLGLEADGESWGGSRFFTSGAPAHFSRIASRMLGRDLSGLVQTALQDD